MLLAVITSSLRSARHDCRRPFGAIDGDGLIRMSQRVVPRTTSSIPRIRTAVRRFLTRPVRTFPERFRRQMILDLFRFHPAEAAAMLDKGNARGLTLCWSRSEGVIGSCGLQPPVPFSGIIQAASKRAADRMREPSMPLAAALRKHQGR